MNKSEWIISGAFALIGAIVMIAGIFIGIDTAKFKETAETAEATILNIDRDYDAIDETTTYDILLEYEVDGEKIQTVSHSYHSGMYEGGTTTIYYNPDNPYDIKSSTSPIFAIFFGGMGLIFFVIGVLMLKSQIKSKSKANNLKTTGTLIRAKIDEVAYNTSYTVNGRHPYVLTASYLDPISNKTLVFNSDNIWFNIKAIVNNHSVDTVDVYYNPSNPSEYYVDADTLKTYIAN